MSGKGIPSEVWARWSKPEARSLKQAVITFGGSIRTEAPIDDYPDVNNVSLDPEPTSQTKGILYLTTKRILFLPKNSLVNPYVCQADYNSLRGISASRNELCVSLIDNNGAVAKFLFGSDMTLFRCFNRLRRLAEASRRDEAGFVSAVTEVVTQPADETPFTSIEVELQECTQSFAISDDNVKEKEESDVDPIAPVLIPLKEFYDTVNHGNFDIRVRLRILFVMSFVAFWLKFIPLIPFFALATIVGLLYTAWHSIDRDLDEMEESSNVNVPPEVEGFAKTRRFINEWIFWENPQYGMLVIEVASGILVAWMVLPPKIFHIACIIAYIVGFSVPLFKSDTLGRVLSGYWLST